MHLRAAGGADAKRLGGRDASDRRRFAQRVVTGRERRQRRSRQFERARSIATSMSAIMCLSAWNEPTGAAEGIALQAVATGRIERRLGAAELLEGDEQGVRVADAVQRAGRRGPAQATAPARRRSRCRSTGAAGRAAAPWVATCEAGVSEAIANVAASPSPTRQQRVCGRRAVGTARARPRNRQRAVRVGVEQRAASTSSPRPAARRARSLR